MSPPHRISLILLPIIQRGFKINKILQCNMQLAPTEREVYLHFSKLMQRFFNVVVSLYETIQLRQPHLSFQREKQLKPTNGVKWITQSVQSLPRSKRTDLLQNYQLKFYLLTLKFQCLAKYEEEISTMSNHEVFFPIMKV